MCSYRLNFTERNLYYFKTLALCSELFNNEPILNTVADVALNVSCTMMQIEL